MSNKDVVGRAVARLMVGHARRAAGLTPHKRKRGGGQSFCAHSTIRAEFRSAVGLPRSLAETVAKPVLLWPVQARRTRGSPAGSMCTASKQAPSAKRRS